MKKILILSLLISCSQFFMSCENWFDVNPKSHKAVLGVEQGVLLGILAEHIV